ncbi:retrotransposon protein, putative, ty1-copia subclass, partial [Tanacetum coccineum]
EGKSVADYVLKMKGYVEQLERLGYMLPQDISVGLILNGLTKDFVGFVRNYNMHNMGKTIGEIHAMLIEYEKGLPKKAETPQVMMIKSGKIQKANKKSLNAKGKNKVNGKGKDKKVYIPKPNNPKPTAKERPAKDDACHHCKEVGHWKRNCPVYLAELQKKRKQVGSASKRSNLVPCCLSSARVAERRQEAQYGYSDQTNGIVQQLTPPYTPQHNGVSERRNRTLLDMVAIQRMNLTTSALFLLGLSSRGLPHAFLHYGSNKEEVEEHSLGDLNEPASYKAAMFDSESNKWIDAMNAEIQSMMDQYVWEPGRSSSLFVYRSISMRLDALEPDVGLFFRTGKYYTRFQQNPGALEWKSSKSKSTNAMSATESKYIAAFRSCQGKQFG